MAQVGADHVVARLRRMAEHHRRAHDHAAKAALVARRAPEPAEPPAPESGAPEGSSHG